MYDCLDQVVAVAEVRESPNDPLQPQRTVFVVATEARGTGDGDPQTWLGAALVQLLERL